jgi:hypothetical protein
VNCFAEAVTFPSVGSNQDSATRVASPLRGTCPDSMLGAEIASYKRITGQLVFSRFHYSGYVYQACELLPRDGWLFAPPVMTGKQPTHVYVS